MQAAFKPHLLQVPESAVVEHYKEPVEFANKQLEILWFPDEIKVEKDVQDILVNMTESERHGVMSVLKLFTLYELKAGNDYWNGKFSRLFKRPEMRRMASVFGMFESSIHMPFYRKLNEALHLDNDAFYMEYMADPVLKDRIEFIDKSISSKNDLLSIATFSMVEGAILYSSFAFLKHFQSQGKNKLLNVVRGINFSVRDENLHSVAGAWTFRTLKEQMVLSSEAEADLKKAIIDAAWTIRDHEHKIAEKIFEKGRIENITLHQLCNFIDSRLNQCLVELGYESIFEVTYNPIAEWFYTGINSFSFVDFFTGVGSNYNRNWDEHDFEYKEWVHK